MAVGIIRRRVGQIGKRDLDTDPKMSQVPLFSVLNERRKRDVVCQVPGWIGTTGHPNWKTWQALHQGRGSEVPPTPLFFVELVPPRNKLKGAYPTMGAAQVLLFPARLCPNFVLHFCATLCVALLPRDRTHPLRLRSSCLFHH